MVDLSWFLPDPSKYELKYELYRDGSLIETIRDRTTTFYRDEGLTKGHTYNYEMRGTSAYRYYTTTATTGEVYGTITRDTAWTATSSPYDLTGGAVSVRNGANLTIEKGVKVTGTAVEQGYLCVSGKGALYADGVSFYDMRVTTDIDSKMVCGHAEIKNCSFEGGRIFLRKSNNNVITGNTVANNAHYHIHLSSSHNNVITGNTVANNAHYGNYGIHLSSSHNNDLTNNTASNNTDGISLRKSNNNSLMDNTASNNTVCGISLFSSCNNTLTDNTASNNAGTGIYLSSSYTTNGIYLTSNYNTLTDNTVANNAQNGIFLSSSSNNNSLMDNTVNDNKYGICLSSSSNNLIYNNYFNNTNNAYDDGNNTWNNPTGGPNIVGGPYIGGNYWSDYKGTDTSSDMLGDTLIPYNCSGGIQNGGDRHPLITIRSYIVTIANNQVGEHYLWGAEGQIPDDGGAEVIMATPYHELEVNYNIAYHTAQETTEGNHYCSGRHSKVTGLPQGDPDNQTHQADYEAYSWLRYDWRSRTWEYGEACEGHRHFDCSGLVHFVYKQAGVTLVRTTAAGYAEMDTDIARTDLKPGDVCYRGRKHIGIYVGGNQITHAAGHDKGVITTQLDASWDGFGRLLPPELDP